MAQSNQTTGEKVSFLKRKNIEFSVQRYLIDALGCMALGLFSSLLIGTIMKTVGEGLNIPFLVDYDMANLSRYDRGGHWCGGGLCVKSATFGVVRLCCHRGGGKRFRRSGQRFVAAVVGAEFGKLVSKETKVDIIVTPTVTILIGVAVGTFIGPGVSAFMTKIGELIMYATTLQPFLMGVLVS